MTRPAGVNPAPGVFSFDGLVASLAWMAYKNWRGAPFVTIVIISGEISETGMKRWQEIADAIAELSEEGQLEIFVGEQSVGFEVGIAGTHRQSIVDAGNYTLTTVCIVFTCKPTSMDGDPIAIEQWIILVKG